MTEQEANIIWCFSQSAPLQNEQVDWLSAFGALDSNEQQYLLDLLVRDSHTVGARTLEIMDQVSGV